MTQEDELAGKGGAEAYDQEQLPRLSNLEQNSSEKLVGKENSIKSNTIAPVWKMVLSAILFLYLVWIVLVLSPSSLLRNQIIHPVYMLFNVFDLEQAWGVFSPNIRAENAHVTAIVTFADGMTKIWEFPRMDRLSFFDRMLMERHRKWSLDRINASCMYMIWPDAARYVARLYKNPVNPPVSVQLLRHWAVIPPPQKGLGHPLPPHTKHQVFYADTVNLEDLSW